MDTTQLLLTITLIVTTIFLIIVGTQLFFVLWEVRKTLTKINNIVEGIEKFGVGLEHGAKEVMGFFAGAKTLFKLTDHLHEKKHGKK